MSNTATKTRSNADALLELDRVDPELQKKLRAWKEKDTIHVVAKSTKLSRESLLRYLHDEPIHASMVRAIQATLRVLHLPEASQHGLRR